MSSTLLASAVLAVTLVPAPQELLARPRVFEPTAGVAPRWIARGLECEAAVDRDGAWLRMRRGDAAGGFGVRFVGAGAEGPAEGEAKTPQLVNHIRGADPETWRIGVPTFERVRCASVWPGIDVVWRADGGALEYDLCVAPGGDPSVFAVRIDGAERVVLDDSGDLVVTTALGECRHHAPIAFQTTPEGRREVAARYVPRGDATFAIELGAWDRTRELVIDPVIAYVARFDGNDTEQQVSVAVDAQGSAVIVGQTSSTDFPVQNPLIGTRQSPTDVFVAKLSADGSSLVYSTYLGGSAADVPGGVAVLPNGNAVVACSTGSPDYPLLNAAFPGPLVAFSGVAGVTVLSPTGTLVWSTYYTLTTATNSPARGVATDAQGNVVICGSTNTQGLPLGNGGFQTQRNGSVSAYVARFDVNGAFLGATYFGLTSTSEALDVAVAVDGKIAVAGRTRFTVPIQGGFRTSHPSGDMETWVAVFDSTLSNLVYSTYVGGSNDDGEVGFEPLGIDVDPLGCVVIASNTRSNDLPTTPGAFKPTFGGLRDGFVAKLDPSLGGAASLVFLTYLGGTATDNLYDVAVDENGHCWLAGATRSTVFPYVHPVQQAVVSTQFDLALLAMLDASGSTLRFASALGTTIRGLNADRVALGPNDAVFFSGAGGGTDIPVTPGAFQTPGGGTSAVWVARLEIPVAEQELYGAGHPGTLGVPALGASIDPMLGSTPNLELGNSLGQTTLAALLIGLLPANLPTPFDGTLLVDLIIFAPSLLVAPGGSTLPLAIPDDNALSGAQLFVQEVVVDVGASQGLAFSRGLRLRIGV